MVAVTLPAASTAIPEIVTPFIVARPTIVTTNDPLGVISSVTVAMVKVAGELAYGSVCWIGVMTGGISQLPGIYAAPTSKPVRLYTGFTPVPVAPS